MYQKLTGKLWGGKAKKMRRSERERERGKWVRKLIMKGKSMNQCYREEKSIWKSLLLRRAWTESCFSEAFLISNQINVSFRYISFVVRSISTNWFNLIRWFASNQQQQQQRLQKKRKCEENKFRKIHLLLLLLLVQLFL